MGFWRRLFSKKQKGRAPGWNWALGTGVHLAPPAPAAMPDYSEQDDDQWPEGRVVLGFEDGSLHPLEEGNRLVGEFTKAADRIFASDPRLNVPEVGI